MNQEIDNLIKRLNSLSKDLSDPVSADNIKALIRIIKLIAEQIN